MRCMRLARCKYRTQKIAKNSPSGYHRTTLSGYIFAMKALSIIGKNLLNSNSSPRCAHNMVNFGPLAAEIGSRVWGTPANFDGFRVLAALLTPNIHTYIHTRNPSKLVGVPQTGSWRQPNFAALNTGRHLYSAGRPSGWASAHILVFVLCLVATIGSLCYIITTRHRASTSMYSLTFCVSRGDVRLCGCLFVCPRPHAHTTAWTRM